MTRRTHGAIMALILLLGMPPAIWARPTLNGTVVDAETNEPVAFVTVTLDTARVVMATSEGFFDFGQVAPGSHVLAFDHIAYQRLVLTIQWPQHGTVAVRLEPAQFITKKIVVTGKRVLPSLPVSAITISRDDLAAIPGNIANDPLRTIQSQPACAVDGVDFLSRVSVRGGDSEENAVYFDDYRLQHYANVGGFASVVYDDMLESTVLVPGAAPLQYKGALSGVVSLSPVRSDTSFASFRYDITSMAGGVSQIVSQTLSVQASAKTSFFNLPAYQNVGVDRRSFKDFLGRAVFSPRPSFSATATLLLGTDSESTDAINSASTHDTQSLLSGVKFSYRPGDWELTLRPSYSYYNSDDGLTFPPPGRTHRLHEGYLFAEIKRRGLFFELGVSGEVGTIRHEGSGGDLRDTAFSSAVETRLMYGETVALALGAGGSREPWTERFEPEMYGSLRVGVGARLTLSAGVRRSHQSPFTFHERRYFASVPIDAGELYAAYVPSGGDARAVQMDQVSAEASLNLPFRVVVSANGFQRWYERLPTWDWSGFPAVANVRGDGEGRGFGQEIIIARQDPDLVSVMLSFARARVWKQEGSLQAERVGDFDRPHSWQAAVSVRAWRQLRLSVRWMDADGRPYTAYSSQSTEPAEAQINAERLPRFRRLDAKLSYNFVREGYDATFFLDVINVRNQRNIPVVYAFERAPGEFTTFPYGGTRFFPIAGITFRF